MIHILWLPSWYPSIDSPQNGDFIERHLLAVSELSSINLLYIQSSRVVTGIAYFNQKMRDGNYVRKLIFPQRKFLKLLNIFTYFFLYNREFKHFYRKEDLPKIVHVHVCYKAGLFALWLKWRYGIPFVLTEHWTFFTLGRLDNFNKSNFFLKFIIKLIFNNASFILPVSLNLSEQLKLSFPKIKSIVIPNVVNPELFYLNYTNSTLFNFIHVSSLNELKNPLNIIRVFNRLRLKYNNICLRVVGPFNHDLVYYINNETIPETVTFLGLKDHFEVAELMRESDAFVLFSSSENLPCVIAESLCCGVPVISSSVGGVPEMVDESNGILVPPGDEDALYKAMESMILNYKKYDRQKISETAQAKYNPDVVGKQIVEVYEKVLSKK